MKLTPLASRIIDFTKKNGGAISAREALIDLDITSASLTRRITEIEALNHPPRFEGDEDIRPVYSVDRQRKNNPVTGKRYTRYFIATAAV